MPSFRQVLTSRREAKAESLIAQGLDRVHGLGIEDRVGAEGQRQLGRVEPLEAYRLEAGRALLATGNGAWANDSFLPVPNVPATAAAITLSTVLSLVTLTLVMMML